MDYYNYLFYSYINESEKLIYISYTSDIHTTIKQHKRKSHFYFRKGYSEFSPKYNEFYHNLFLKRNNFDIKIFDNFILYEYEAKYQLYLLQKEFTDNGYKILKLNDVELTEIEKKEIRRHYRRLYYEENNK